MNNNKNNIFRNDDLESFTIPEVVEKMFSLCDENGTLFIPEFGDGISNGENDLQRLKLKWSKNDVSAVIKECESIVYEIETIAKTFSEKDALNIKKEEIELSLPAMSCAVWVNYLEKDYAQIEDKKLFFVLFYAQRFYKLLQLGAPQIVLNNERNLLTQAIVVNKYATSIKCVKMKGKTTEKKKCSMCGKDFDVWDCQEDFCFDRHIGYGSEFDLKHIKFNLCCKCFDKVLKMLLPMFKETCMKEYDVFPAEKQKENNQ